MRCQNARPRVEAGQRVTGNDCCNRTAVSILRSARHDKAQSLVLSMRLGKGLHIHFRDLSLSRRVALRVLAAFLATVALLRIFTAIIHYQLFPHGPFRDVITKTGLHIHHLFWGILLLMITGFGALASRAERWHLRIAVVFGIALGMTLDEFALWLRLTDVYWSPEGIESIQAIAVVAAILAAYGFGLPFWHARVRDAWKSNQ